MSQETEEPKWGSEFEEEVSTVVEESPLGEPLDPLTQSLADKDAAPEEWSLSHTGTETLPELIARTGAQTILRDMELPPEPDPHLPAHITSTNPFETVQDSTTDRVASQPVVIGPHAAPPIIGAWPRAPESRPIEPRPNEPRPNEPRPNEPRPIEPRPNEPRPIEPAGTFGTPRFTQPSRTHASPEPERPAPQLGASSRAVAGEEHELWVKVGIGVALVGGALLTILLVALIVAALTAA